MYKLTIIPLVLVVLTIAPAHADRLPIEVSPVASLDGGPVLGGALSYPVLVFDPYQLWADIGAKNADNGGNIFIGASTDAWKLLDEVPLVKVVFPVLDFALPDKARLMGAYIFGADEWMFAVRVPLLEF